MTSVKKYTPMLFRAILPMATKKYRKACVCTLRSVETNTQYLPNRNAVIAPHVAAATVENMYQTANNSV